MQSGSRRRDRAGFTLVELLVVLLIVAIIAGVTLPVVIPAISHRQVSESARIIQGGLVVARDAALRFNAPHGIRFLPDPTYNGLDPATGVLNPFRTLASNRFVPIEQPPGYSEGKVFLADYDYTDSQWWLNDPMLATDATGRFMTVNRRVLLLVQSVLAPDGSVEPPTSWYWNVRVGDRVQINGQGRWYTIVGPMQTQGAANPEKFVNIGELGQTMRLPHPSGGDVYPEILFLVNGLDDDGDGYIDNGWDGLDNDGNGVVDDAVEWSEIETPPSLLMTQLGQSRNGVGYQIYRQPVPSPGARETILPESVVVDLTGWGLDQPERSRLPVDPFSGNVDILLDPGGRVIPTTRYSSPTSVGMGAGFYHIWVGERSDLAELIPDGSAPPVAASLVSGFPFKLPMPLGQNVETLTENASSYDALVEANPTLATLEGEMRLLTLSARSGNLITTDRPTFSVTNPSQPYRAPQMGIQGDAP